MERPTLSLVLPIYNEEEVIPELHKRLQDFLPRLGESCEVIFVNDGSKDRSFEMLADIAKDGKIIQVARDAVVSLLEKDPSLSDPYHVGVKEQLEEVLKKSGYWGRIS